MKKKKPPRSVPPRISKPPAEQPPRVDNENLVPVSTTTRCAFCDMKIRTACIRDLRITLKTESGIAGEISLTGKFFCPPVEDPTTGTTSLACVTSTAKVVMQEADEPRDPDDPVFPQIQKRHRGRIVKYELGYCTIGAAPMGSAPASGPGDIHGAGWKNVTTPGFADAIIPGAG